jgi:hypothetical protein
MLRLMVAHTRGVLTARKGIRFSYGTYCARTRGPEQF